MSVNTRGTIEPITNSDWMRAPEARMSGKYVSPTAIVAQRLALQKRDRFLDKKKKWWWRKENEVHIDTSLAERVVARLTQGKG